MEFVSQRGADPFKADVTVRIEDADIAAAFSDASNAGLFYAFLQARATWDKLAISTRLRIVADVVELAEKDAAAKEKSAAKAK